MRHIQNNYQYMTHVYEARITNFELTNLHVTKEQGSRSNTQLDPSIPFEAPVNKKPEPILGNVYGSLKRASNSTEPFVYEYFEGSTNKIKYPLKFSSLMEMFQ